MAAVTTWMLVGLGNPGAQYQLNRHNVGFMALDAIASDYSVSFSKKDNSHWAELPSVTDSSDNKHRIFLLKPQTFMNVCGPAIASFQRFYHILRHHIIVFHDDLDIPLGCIKVKRGGGAGGHNGLRSLDAHGGADYERVRIGIGHPGDKALVHHHVLSDFNLQERQEYLVPLLTHIKERYTSFVAQGMSVWKCNI